MAIIRRRSGVIYSQGKAVEFVCSTVVLSV